VRKSEGMKPFGRYKHRREDNNEIDLEKKMRVRYVLNFCDSGEGQMLDCCEHSNESLNSMKCAS